MNYFWLAAIVVSPSGQLATADLLYLHGDPQPVVGLVVRGHGDPTTVLNFKVFTTPEQPLASKTYAAENVASLVVTVDQERLESLQIQRWDETRAVAEELAGFKSDPVARQIAIRLNLLLLYQASRDLNYSANATWIESAARNLIHLAEGPDESKRFQMLGHLYAGIPVTMTGSEIDVADNNRLLAAVQACRRRQPVQSQKLLKPLVEKFDRLPPAVQHWTAITVEANQGDQLDLQVLGQLLEAEITLRREIDKSDSQPQTNALVTLLRLDLTRFAEAFDQTLLTTVESMAIEDVAGFDLQATRFKSGEWKRP
jgi:hypothetical protein